MNSLSPIFRRLSRLRPSCEAAKAGPKHNGGASPARAQRRRYAQSKEPAQPADAEDWISPIERPQQIVKSGSNKHGPGLIILAIMPLTAFALGTWQIQRLTEKTELIARYEDRLIRPPLPLPPHINPDVIPEFDYRRVYARGKFRHDQEMLLGPRTHDGEDGYQVITPLERWDPETGEPEGKILVNRGWISRSKEEQKSRVSKTTGTTESSLPTGEVTISGLLRKPFKGNMFSPSNEPTKNKWYFSDIAEMASHVGASPVWVEQTMEPDLIVAQTRQAEGNPIGRPAEVNLRNNHLQYIVTWYALGVATSVMFWMLLRRPPNEIQRRVRRSKDLGGLR